MRLLLLYLLIFCYHYELMKPTSATLRTSFPSSQSKLSQCFKADCGTLGPNYFSYLKGEVNTEYPSNMSETQFL